MIEFGEQLRRAREEKGMTQQTLAEQLYVTRQAVSRWECGDRYPDLITTKNISRILDVSLDDLLSGKDMTKVVERNPVVENKAANNIIIALFTLIVAGYLYRIVSEVVRFTMGDGEYRYVYNIDINGFESGNPLMFINAIVSMIIIGAIFTYGMVQAVRDTLSPKRLGAVFVSYSAIGFFSNIRPLILYIHNVSYGSISSIIFIQSVLEVIVCAIALVALFMFYFKKINKMIWIVIITIRFAYLAITYIAATIIYFSNLRKDMTLVAASYSGLVIGYALRNLCEVAIAGLVIFQTITLYNKRKRALGVENSYTEKVPE